MAWKEVANREAAIKVAEEKAERERKELEEAEKLQEQIAEAAVNLPGEES